MAEIFGVSASNGIKESSLKKIEKKSEGSANVPMVKGGKTNAPPKFPIYDENKYGSVEKYKEQKAKYNFKNDTKSGALVYTPAQEYAWGLYKSDAHYLYNNKDRATFGEIKSRYNIPDGVLWKDNGGTGGGDRDHLKAPSVIDIPADVLDKIVK